MKAKNQSHKHIWILQALFFIAAVSVLTYFFPREGKFRYNFQEGKPWKYGLLTASFDFPIYKSDERIAYEKDSLLRNFEPFFSAEKEIAKSNISALEKTLKSYQEMPVPYYLYEKIIQSVKKIYDDGIVSSEVYDQIQNNKIKSVRIIDKNIAKEYPVQSFRSARKAYETVLEEFPDVYTRHILQSCNLNDYLAENMKYDSITTNKFKEDLLQRVSLSSGVVQAGERIVDRGEIITPQTYLILKSLETVTLKKNTNNNLQEKTVIGQVIVFTCLLLFFYLFLALFRPGIFNDLRKLGFLMMLIVGISLAAFFLAKFRLLGLYLVPFAIIPIVTVTFLDSRVALYVHIITVLICSFCAPFALEFIFLQIIAGMTAIDSLSDMVKRSQLVRTAILVYISYCITYTGYTMLTEGDLNKLNLDMFLYLGINCICILFAYLIIFFFEKIFGFVSTVTLVELSDVNNPLLRQLSEECPGTFEHTLQVSNLAAEAANKIGARSQLARTGALYHDIGKLKNPAFFTENQSGVNPHSTLPFEQSAQIIISHVKDGAKMADKQMLPLPIRDFILMHHGRGKAKYFYNSYCNKYPDKPVDEEKFMYPGPNPNTKETGIVMMADSVEAASRSLKEYTEESISKLVNSIIDGQVSEGLLKQTPLSFRDVEIIKQTFIEKLKTIYHTRISYPELNSDNKEEKENGHKSFLDIGSILKK